jgi:hypothetical protein
VTHGAGPLGGDPPAPQRGGAVPGPPVRLAVKRGTYCPLSLPLGPPRSLRIAQRGPARSALRLAAPVARADGRGAGDDELDKLLVVAVAAASRSISRRCLAAVGGWPRMATTSRHDEPAFAGGAGRQSRAGTPAYTPLPTGASPSPLRSRQLRAGVPRHADHATGTELDVRARTKEGATGSRG